MLNHRFAGCLLCLVLLLGLIPGCQVFHADQTLAVLVRDAETKKPIPTAEVYLCQRLKGDEVAPCRSPACLTQADGIARLRAELAGEFGLQVQAVAEGYLPEKVNVPAEALKTRVAAASSAKGKRRSPDVVVEVYAEPVFSVELVLPPGYHGLVKAEIQIQDNLPLPPGQRCFCFPVSPSGDVVVRGPSLLRRVAAADYRARYANGPLLGTTMDAEKIGFRWLRGTDNQHYFVVGTQLDYEALHSRLAPEETRAASGPGDDASHGGRSHKYRYGKVTAKNYE
jgi:hypothetical protein